MYIVPEYKVYEVSIDSWKSIFTDTAVMAVPQMKQMFD
jgi:hypothetical protein